VKNEKAVQGMHDYILDIQQKAEKKLMKRVLTPFKRRQLERIYDDAARELQVLEWVLKDDAVEVDFA
jgi:hypothetical protein